MRLQLMTWTEVKEYLETSKGIIVPIGSTEQHGPTGFIGTDAICAEVVALGVGQAADAIVAPTISVGMSEHHMRFSGSITLAPSTLLMVIRDYIISLARHGFERIFFINGHGGNFPTMQASFSEVYSIISQTKGEMAAHLRCKGVSWWHSRAAVELSEKYFGDRNGDHATAAEISLSWQAYPNDMRQGDHLAEAAPCQDFYTSEDFARRFSDGRIGSDPSLASPEAGRDIYRGVVSDLTDMYMDFIKEA